MERPNPNPYTINGAGAAIAAAQSQQFALPASIQRPLSQLVPKQQAQMADINNYTPSCSRCRQKKLKCDTNLPCNQCIAKDLDDVCRKDSRIPRGRKRPKLEATGSHEDAYHDEVASLKNRIRELENAMSHSRADQRSPNRSTPFSESSAMTSDASKRMAKSACTSSTSLMSPESSRRYSDGRTSPTHMSSSSDDELTEQADDTMSALEKLGTSDPRAGQPGHDIRDVKQRSGRSPTQIAHDGRNTYYSQPSVFQERYNMLLLAKRLVPAPFIVDELVYTFGLRCNHFVGHIIHMPSFIESVHFFNRAGVEEIIASHLDMFDLARYLMVLRLAIRFYPRQGTATVDHTTPAFIAINALRRRDDDIPRQWHDLAKKALAADRIFNLGSFRAIQAALLMIFDGRDSPNYIRMLLRTCIQSALDMGLHRLGTAMPSAKHPEEDMVRLETGVRIWWYMVVKDWCMGQREGVYTLHPSQMTTRRPLHTSDERLSQNRTDEIPPDQHCDMSYILAEIQLAHIIRESIDLRNEQSMLGGNYDVISPTNKKMLQAKLEALLNEDLPSFYRLESTVMTPRIVGPQRSLLHQQIFDILLKLNRRSLGMFSEREACTLLAEKIISTQQMLQKQCPVIEGFWINFLHLFGAALSLTISLLLDQGLEPEVRHHRRSVVHQALSTMQRTPDSEQGSYIIQMLLQEEERHWIQRGNSYSHRSQPDLAALTRTIIADMAVHPRSDADSYHTFASNGSISKSNTHKTAAILDVTPDESILPAIASSWGDNFPFSDPCDPTNLLSTTNSMADVSSGDVQVPQRSYEHSLRPWQEPAPPSYNASTANDRIQQNYFWDWALLQGALLHGPPYPYATPSM